MKTSEDFDIRKWNELKKLEFLRNGGPNWNLDFDVDPTILDKIQKMHETSSE